MNPSRPSARPRRARVVGSETGITDSPEIVRFVPTNVAKERGLMNSSVITSVANTEMLVRAAAPPDPVNSDIGMPLSWLMASSCPYLPRSVPGVCHGNPTGPIFAISASGPLSPPPDPLVIEFFGK